MLFRLDETNESVRQVRRYRNLQYNNATYRAMIGAELLLNIPIKPRGLLHAATMVGSTPQYIAAMKTLIEADAWSLISAVLDDRIPLLGAAHSMRTRAKLLSAYSKSDIRDRAALGQFASPAAVWDEQIIPNIS